MIKESFIFIGIKAVTLGKDFLYLIINQMSSQIEIERLNKEVPLYVSEFVINHQNSIENIFVFLIFLFAIWGICIMVNDIPNIITIFRKGVK